MDRNIIIRGVQNIYLPSGRTSVQANVCGVADEMHGYQKKVKVVVFSPYVV